MVSVGLMLLEELLRAEHQVAHPTHKLVRRPLRTPIAVRVLERYKNVYLALLISILIIKPRDPRLC